MRIHTMTGLWVCVFMCVTSVLTFGLTISDDFTDNIQADWWETLFFDPDHAWLETSGRLELLTDGTVDSAAFYTGTEWMLDATQDFSLKVSYYHGLTTFNYTDVMIAMGPAVLTSDDHLQFSASSYENNKEFYVELMDNGTQLVDESFGSTSTFGTLYVSYDAGLDELYLSSIGYGSTNAQKTISGIIGGNWSGSPLLVGLGGSVDNYVVVSGELYLDDFVMDSGTIIQSGMTGLGTEAAPYIIDSLADFDQFAGDSKYWNDYVRLEADIDLSERTYTTAVIAPDTDNTISGFQGEYYRGVFDGNDHIISHLTINTGMLNNWFLGLFGNTNSGAEIMNLGLENVSIIGGSGSTFTGGLCGFPYSCPVKDCYVTGTVSGGYNTGGLLGCLLTSTERCYALCAVSGSDEVGGLIGGTASILSGSLTHCFASGIVVGTGDSVGGLVGNANQVKYTDCYALGSVTGHENVGGLIGKTNGNYSEYNYLNNCYAACQVTGTGSNNIGGFVGYNDSPINNCFWDTTVSGTTDGDGSADPDPEGLVGLDTTEMQTRSTYTDVGWDFSDDDGDAADWQMPVQSYPRLAWESVESSDPSWQLVSNMLTARDQFAGGVVGDEIFVFGGNGNPDQVNLRSGEYFNIATSSWSSIADHPDFETFNGIEEVCGVGYGGKFYVFGGWTYVSGKGYSGTANFNEVYDPSTDTWMSLAQKPTAAQACSIAVYGSEIFLFGGMYEDEGPTGDPIHYATVEAYNPSTNTWRSVTNIPKTLTGFAVAVYDGRAYVIGGYEYSTDSFNTEVMVYDFGADSWTRNYCTVSNDAARVYSYASPTPVIDGKVYLIGGIEGTSGSDAQPSDKFTIFDIDAQTTESKENLPEARSGHLAVIHDETCYVIGGYSEFEDIDRAESTVYAYDCSNISSDPVHGRFFWQVLKSDFPSFGIGYGLRNRVNIPEAISCELKGPDMADYTAAVWDDGLKNWKWEVLYLTLSELQQMSLGTWQLKLIHPDASETVYEFSISGSLDESEFLPVPIIQQPAHTTSNVIAEHYMLTWSPGGDQSAADDMYLEIGGDTFNYFSSSIDLSATQWYPGWLELGSAYCKVGYVDYRNDLITTPSLISGQEINWDVFFASLVSADKNYFYVKYSLDLMKDGLIDLSDLVLFCSHWMETLPSVANFDDTGYVGLEDFSIFAQHWQENASDLAGSN